MRKDSPTTEFYNFFETIYNFYNESLFNNELPKCIFIVTRKKDSFGYFIPERWVNNEKIKSDEIAINPLMFGKYQLPEILKTVAHEMCHLWQHHLGTPSQRTYHNKEWGDKMEAIGLMPSNTGAPGGKKTGQQMMDYVIEDGLFHLETKKLIGQDIFKKIWFDRTGLFTNDSLEESNVIENLTITTTENLGESVILNTSRNSIFEAPDFFSPSPSISSSPVQDPSKLKIKYSCPVCDFNVWGRSGLKLRCNECKSNYEEQQIKKAEG